MRRGVYWPPTWTGTLPLVGSIIAILFTRCCRMVSLCLIGCCSLTRWEWLRFWLLQLFQVMKQKCLAELFKHELISFSADGPTMFFSFFPCKNVFQRVDAPSLLRLLLNFDLLEAAAELVLEYVDAVLGLGHQYFGIEVHVQSVLHLSCGSAECVVQHFCVVSLRGRCLLRLLPLGYRTPSSISCCRLCVNPKPTAAWVPSCLCLPVFTAAVLQRLIHVLSFSFTTKFVINWTSITKLYSSWLNFDFLLKDSESLHEADK